MKQKRSHVIERECQIWLGGCLGAPAGRCHFRLQGVSGMGLKVPDLMVAWGCASCHTIVDTDKSPEVQLQFAKGVFRTQVQRMREGEITDA
jgi:hypothetical protein